MVFERVGETLSKTPSFSRRRSATSTLQLDGSNGSVISSAPITLDGRNNTVVAIEKDMALGRVYAVNQTPTTIIHYKGQTYPVVGIVSYDVLHQFLDQLLSQ